MKTTDVESLSKAITTVGTGSSTLTLLVVITIYSQLPVTERKWFIVATLVVMIFLSVISIIGQLISFYLNKLNIKVVEKEIEKPVYVQRVIIRKEEEIEKTAMTDTWMEQYQ